MFNCGFCYKYLSCDALTLFGNKPGRKGIIIYHTGLDVTYLSSYLIISYRLSDAELLKACEGRTAHKLVKSVAL